MAEKKEYVKLWLSYESYFEPYSAAEVGRLVLAMMKYRASGVEPEFSGSERFVWPAIRRDIDESLQAQEAAAEVSRQNGRKGGRPSKPKEPAKKYDIPENPSGFLGTQKSYGLRTEDKGQGQGQGQGQDNARARDLAAVMSAYMDKISPNPSQTSLDELKAYTEAMGSAVCLRAIDAALDAGKANWSYIRAILRNKQSQGVRCLADWDRLEEGRDRNGTTGNQNPTAGTGRDGKTWNVQAVDLG